MTPNLNYPDYFPASPPSKQEENSRRGSGNRSNRLLKISTLMISSLLILAFILSDILPASAQSETRILNPGDAVVTGFSGIKAADVELGPEGKPLDKFFIDTQGSSAQIKSLKSMNGAPEGQLVDAPATRHIKASEVGQVFAIALDDGLGGGTPNIYLGATSYYGIQIVHPDNNGDGKPDRLKTGAASAQFMEGQFGPGGSPGSIWRVDGTTGKITLFATIPDNSGAGIGDIVFDKSSQQFFVSDLESGLIYRISKDGEIQGTFDHGVKGRPAQSLSEVADDGKVMDITDASFDSEDTSTWGYTQKERRVGGMAVRDGRLYYAVNQQVWSVGIAEDGFADDARREFEVADLPGEGPITDMLFDAEGRIYLAQRGKSKGSYSYSEFTEPGKSNVVRYRKESPDDPETESVWVSDAEKYAIGMPEDHNQADGGIALGYKHDDTGAQVANSCNAMLWSTGSRLRSSSFKASEVADELGEVDASETSDSSEETEATEGSETSESSEASETSEEMDIHGLQGNSIDLVRPDNTPPNKSYFVDYDSLYNDAAKSGHMGDVEIWQPCQGATFTDLGEPEPGDIPDDFPPDWIPPKIPFEANLRITKWASPKKCKKGIVRWRCRFRIRIRNTGPNTYIGPIKFEDRILNPLGSTASFFTPAGWNCWNVGAGRYHCGRPWIVLLPGQSVLIKAVVKVKRNYPRCHIKNVAEILWAPGGTQWNTKVFDDIDGATAFIPKRNCPKGKKSNLRLKKKAFPKLCKRKGNRFLCRYRITVRNTGPGKFKGKIRIKDTTAPGTTLIGSAPGVWNCNLASGVCKHPFTTLLPGQAKHLWVWVRVNRIIARKHKCRIKNYAKIQFPFSPSLKNTNPADDDDSAFAKIPDYVCKRPQRTNLLLRKTAIDPCVKSGDEYTCRYRVRVQNTGPGTYLGDLVVRERYPQGVTFSGPANWTCVNAIGSSKRCKLSNVAIGSGSFRDLYVRLRVSADRARRLNCKIKNLARILIAPGGTFKNTNAGDDADDAVATVPELCRKDPPRCPPGFPWNPQTGECEPTVIIVPPGKLCPPGMRHVSSTQARILKRRGWRVVRVGRRWCAKPPRVRECRPGYKKLSSSLARVMRRRGWTVYNNGDHWCGKPGEGRQCRPGFKKLSASTARVLKRRGWRIYRSGNLWCGKPGPVRQCRSGYKKLSASAARVMKRRGWIIYRNGDHWCGKPGRIRQCRSGYKKLSASTARVMKRRGWIIYRNGDHWCGKPGRTTSRSCPPGMKQLSASNARSLRRRGWHVIRVGRKWCGRPGRNIRPRRCPPGTFGRWPNCRRIQRTCPPGTTGRWPRCRNFELRRPRLRDNPGRQPLRLRQNRQQRVF